jgi:hypothetical protein
LRNVLRQHLTRMDYTARELNCQMFLWLI